MIKYLCTFHNEKVALVYNLSFSNICKYDNKNKCWEKYIIHIYVGLNPTSVIMINVCKYMISVDDHLW